MAITGVGIGVGMSGLFSPFRLPFPLGFPDFGPPQLFFLPEGNRLKGHFPRIPQGLDASGDSGLAITASGGAVTVTGLAAAVESSFVIFTLSRTVLAGETATVTYDSDQITLEGEPMSPFVDAVVTNESTQT